MRHYVVTKWNIRSMGTLARKSVISPEWFERRREIFERYCLPSVVGQTMPYFAWIILLDAHTSDKEVAWFAGKDERIVPVLVEQGPDGDRAGGAAGEQASEVVRGGAGWVTTTRLDSDDMLHPEYLERLLEVVSEERRFVEFKEGLYYDLDSGATCYAVQPSNAFSTLVEPAWDAKTIYCIEHHKIREVGAVLALDTLGWLASIHESNMTSQLYGAPVYGDQRAGLLAQFGITP